MCRIPWRVRIVAHVLSLISAVALDACVPMTEEGRLSMRAVRVGNTPTVAVSTIMPTATLVWPTPTVQSGDTPVPFATATVAPESRQWLQQSGLLQSPHDEDVEQLHKAARAEARVVLYSDTARAATALESFLSNYSGLEGEAYTTGSHDIYLALVQDATRSEPVADVYLASDAPRTLQALAQKRIWNYVPPEIKEVVPEAMREPLLVHHWSAVLLVYSGAEGASVPIDNWWDLTRDEWRGRMALPDPLIDARMLYFLVTCSQRAQDLARAYADEFGRPIALDSDCPDAGCQWVKALLRNSPRLFAGDAEVAAWVGDGPTGEVRLGICGSEQLAKARRGKAALNAMVHVVPAAGMQWPSFVALVDRGQHPNAGKLLVRWLLGDAQGALGYAVWHDVGLYPARTDVPDPSGAPPRDELEPRLWVMDPVYAVKELDAVRDRVKATR